MPLGYAATFLSRYLHSAQPGANTLDTSNLNLKNTLGYLKRTLECGIHYTRDIARSGLRHQKPNTLYALSDSDFAGYHHSDDETARSTPGNVILMHTGHVMVR